MLALGLDEIETEPVFCRCGHPASAHRPRCCAGHLPQRHLVEEARKAAKRRGLDPILLALAVLFAMGPKCNCARYRADL